MSQGPRERLISAAIGLVQQNGVAGTGLAELLERSCSARRSLYQHFPGGKNQLIEASTREAGRYARDAVRELGATMDPVGVLGAMLDLMAENLESTDFRHGCPIAAAASAPTDADVVRSAAGAAFADWLEAIEEVLVRDGRSPTEAHSLAGFLLSGVEGALLLARVARSTEPLDHAREHLTALLRAAAPRGAAASRPA